MIKPYPAKPLAAFLAAVIIFSGCSVNRAIYVPYESKLYPPKTEIAPVTIGYDIDQPYDEMGSIIAYGRWLDGYDRVNELFMEKAREIGADAVIRVRYHPQDVFSLSFIFFSAGYVVAAGQGTAVKFRKNGTPL